MRYRIVAFETPEFNAQAHTIYDPRFNRLVPEAKLTQKINAIDDLVLTVNKDSWLYNKSDVFKIHVNVYNLSNSNELTFRGRLIKTERKMTSSGEFVQELTFESIIGYLLDSTIAPLTDNTGAITPRQLVEHIILSHNDSMEDFKRLYLNPQFKDETIEDDEPGGKHTYDLDYKSSWDTLKSEILDRLGLYMRNTFTINDGHYENIVEIAKDIGVERNQEIKIGINMQSASVSVDPSQIFTRLIPLGATTENPEKSDRTKTRLSIQRVNDGKPYIENAELVNKFGIIYKYNAWDDVTDANEVKRLGEDYMAKQIIAINNWQVDTFETDDVTFYVGDKYKFVNDEIAISQYLRIMEKEIDITSPNNVTLKIESTNSNLTDFQLEQLRMNKQIAELQREKAQDKRKIEKLIEKVGRLNRDQLVTAGSGQTVAGGPTEPVNGDWGPVIEHAARLMNVQIDNAGVNLVKAQINLESGGNEKALGGDDGLSDGRASGLLQYKPGTFNYYSLEGHKDIWKGFDQLLAFFNIPNALSQITGQSGWSPHGAPRYSKVPNSESSASGGAKRLQDEARKYLGVKYVWGGNRPIGTNPRGGMDCSSFVAQVYHDLGISVPAWAVTTSLEPMGHEIPRSQVQAG
ncbi:MAG: phage tail protein, partial [Bacteroidales bacterium]|nr:phage tail protein [Bacteroidales bacterium]